jgi:hypothetical protein
MHTNAHWAIYDWRIDDIVDLLDQHKQQRNNDRENVGMGFNVQQRTVTFRVAPMLSVTVKASTRLRIVSTAGHTLRSAVGLRKFHGSMKCQEHYLNADEKVRTFSCLYHSTSLVNHNHKRFMHLNFLDF